MNVYSGDGHINVGSGEDMTILDLAQLVCESSASRARSSTISPNPTERHAN